MAKSTRHVDPAVPKLTFGFRSRNAQAFGRLLPDGRFTVLADSTAVKESSATEKRDREERDSLVQQGILIDTGETNLLRFVDDYTFTSASRAAGVIRDGNVSGPENWIEHRSGMSLRDFLGGDPAFAPLGVDIPEYVKPDSSPASAPFSKSSHALFKRETLGSDGAGDGPRTDYFKQHLVRIFNEIGNVPVPYRFLDSKGARRSMDGGCLKFVGPDGQDVAEFVYDANGYIVAVRPKPLLIETFTSPEFHLASDIAAIEDDASVSATQREQLISARLGQGKFRAGVLARWDGQCAVTGCSLGAAIRASHVLPWRDATNEERLDPDNGLPLVATLDALFDTGHIAFDDDGTLMASELLKSDHTALIAGYERLTKKPNARLRAYLTRHRARFGY